MFAAKPTIGSSKYLPDATVYYYWGAGQELPPAWLKTATDVAAGTDWPSGDNLLANTPRYLKSLDFDGLIEYEPQATSNCDPGFAWDACTDYLSTSGTSDVNGKWKRTVFDAGSLWCQAQSQNGPWTGACRDVRRVLMHEWGHGVGLSRKLDSPTGVDKHSLEAEAVTVMRLTTPTNGNTGYATHSLQECDVMRLQMLYDVNAASNGFPNCSTEIPNQVNTSGLYTATAVTSGATYAACLGQAVVVSGYLRLKLTSDYGALSGNTLSSRTLHFDRKLPADGAWTTKVTSTVTSTTSANWSKSFVSSVPITYQFRAKFYETSELNVGESTSATWTISWTSPC